MDFAKIYSAQTVGLDAEIIDVEIDLAKGLHSFNIVGLADKAVDESRDRVSAALKNANFTKSEDFQPPKSHNKKIVVSLAPADIKKTGPLFDLPIALAYLLSTKEIRFNPQGKLFVGELSLSGELRAVSGILPIVQKARKDGFKEIFVPKENAREAALVSGIKVYGAETLDEVINFLDTAHKRESTLKRQEPTKINFAQNPQNSFAFDEIKSQDHAKRGLVIAAAGGHNIALYGPPGTGKTMLAKALGAILPPLSPEDALEVTGIHSVAGALNSPVITAPPIRAPHHTASYVALVGGGTNPAPGEVTLAHKGVLFLDEFPEFDKRVINALRQPLEDKVVTVSRASGTLKFKSDFILIAALNPCPCGYYGTNKCTCTQYAIERYKNKISGPIMDRIDMWIEVGAIDYSELSKKTSNTNTQTLSAREQVLSARAIQSERFKHPSRLNAGMSARGLEYHATLSDPVRKILNDASERMNLSPRAYHRVIKLARTIADLEQSDSITDAHILEALGYRPKQEF